MNLRDLKYIVAVADEKHFGRAAEECAVSQPTLSAQIIKLEDYLQIQIFERHRGNLIITPAGAEIIQQARIILDHAEQIHKISAFATDRFAGTLSLGIIPTIAPYLLPLILKKLASQLPKLTLQLKEAQTHQLISDLKDGKIDAMILALPTEETTFKEIDIYREDFYLAVPENHPFAQKKVIQTDTLDGESFMLLEEGHCLRDQTMELCRLKPSQIGQSLRATSIETLLEMVRCGHGMTVVPELVTKQGRGNICFIPFAKPIPHRRVGLVFRQTFSRQDLMVKLVETMQGIL